MSYAMSAALQAAVFQRLQGDAALGALVGGAIYDALPAGSVPGLYVSLGAETVLDRSDQTGRGALHRFVVSVVSEASGFGQAKTAAAAITDALDEADLTLSRGRLVFLRFERASARRRGTTGNLRQIDLSFRARVEDDQP